MALGSRSCMTCLNTKYKSPDPVEEQFQDWPIYMGKSFATEKLKLFNQNINIRSQCSKAQLPHCFFSFSFFGQDSKLPLPL